MSETSLIVVGANKIFPSLEFEFFQDLSDVIQHLRLSSLLIEQACSQIQKQKNTQTASLNLLVMIFFLSQDNPERFTCHLAEKLLVVLSKRSFVLITFCVFLSSYLLAPGSFSSLQRIFNTV